MNTIDITYALNVVDRGISKLLRDDRDIRKSVTQTSKEMARQAREAVQGATKTSAAAHRSAAAVRTSGTAARAAAADTQRLATQARSFSVAAGRSAAAANRQADAYRRVGREATAAARAQRTAASAAKSAAGGVGAAGSRVGGLAAAAGAGVGAASIVGAFVGFEKQMDRVQATADTTTARMQAMTAQAKQLGADTAFSAKEAADGMYQLATAGFKADQIMKIIPGTLSLASASGTDLAAAAELQAAAIRGFGLSAKDATHVADVLAKTVNSSAVEMADLGETLPYVASTARQTGTSFEQVAAAAGILGNAGIKGSMAGTALRTSMLRLTDPTKKMGERLRDMGISSKELAAIPLPEVIGRVAEGLKKLPTRGAKVGAISAIFGKEAAPSMLNLMSKGRKGIDDLVKSLEHSQGAAKKTADIMRDNVAGAWDNFTGSIETASITLVERFGPAMKNALTGAAGGVNAIAAVLTGKTVVRGKEAVRKVDGGVEYKEATKTERLIAKIRDTIGTVAGAAVSAGRQLLAAFKPAEPFLRNILLPLLTGLAKGVLSSVVTAFKVAVPVIKVFAGVLGAIGIAARPLRPVFAGIGSVIGFVLAGPILKGIGAIGKLGGSFRILGAPIRAAGALLRGIAGIMSGVGRVIGGVVGRVTGLQGKFTEAAKGIVTGLVRGLAGLGGRVLGFFTRAFSSVFKFVGGVGGRLFGVGKSIVQRLVDGIRSAPSAIVDALKSLIPGPLRGLASKASGVVKSLFGGRAGGVARFQDGGLIASMVSPGERVDYGGASWTVPGARTAADSVFAMLPAGAAVMTDHGQQLLAAGASTGEALRAQMPHFMGGGRVAEVARGAGFSGRNLVTALAVAKAESRWNEAARHVNTNGTIDRGLWQINSVHGALSTFDPTANARAAWKLSKGGRSWKPWVTYNSGEYSRYMEAARTASKSGKGAGPNRMLGSSRTRGGLLSDAFNTGYDAGLGGLTLSRIKRDGSPIASAVREALRAAAPTTSGTSSSGASGTSKGGLSAAMALARSAGLGITSIRGGKHVAGSWHGKGRAFDAAGPAGSMRRYALDAAKRYGPRLLELFYDPLGWYIKNGRRVKGSIGGHGGHVHTAMRRGGLVGYQAGGTVGAGSRLTAGLGRAMTFAGGSLDALDSIIQRSMEQRLLALRQQLLKQVKKGGSAKVVNRLQGVISLIEGELGRRVGRIVDVVQQRTADIERGRGALDRMLRTSDVAADSSEGIAALAAYEHDVAGILQKNVASLTSAVARAQHAGQADKVRELTGMLQDAQDSLAENLVRQIELMRDAVRAAAEEMKANVALSMDEAQSVFAGLDADQRLAGTRDTAAGMRQRAGFIQGSMLPHIQQTIDAANWAASTATTAEEWRTAMSDAWHATVDFKNAQADAADLVRDAAKQEAEDRVNAIRQKGEDRVSGAQFELSWRQNNLGQIEARQRLAGVDDTPAGMRERAGYLKGEVSSRIRDAIAAFKFNADKLWSIGDVDGWRQAMLDAQGATTDLANAQADAADLMRAAAEKVVQERVDIASHGTTMADLGLQRLELEQRIAGTADSAGGAQQRADFIRQQIVPALDTEIIALTAQQMEAQKQGNTDLVRQLQEAIFAKQTDILQKNLDATEQTAENTELLKEFGGSTAFGFRDQTYTDLDVIAARAGA